MIPLPTCMSQLTIWGTARRRRRRAGSGSSVDNRCNTKMTVLADLGSQTFGSGACARMCTENTQTGHLNGQGHGRHSSFAALEHGRGRDTRFDSPRLKSMRSLSTGTLHFSKKLTVERTFQVQCHGGFRLAPQRRQCARRWRGLELLLPAARASFFAG